MERITRKVSRPSRPEDSFSGAQKKSIQELRETVLTNRLVISVLIIGFSLEGFSNMRQDNRDLAEKLGMNLRDEGDRDSRIELSIFRERPSLTFRGEKYDKILGVGKWSPTEGRMIYTLREGYGDDCMQIVVDGNPATEIRPEKCYK